MLNLIHGDCLEVMKTIPDKSIDAIITDPPYGTTACKWDAVIPFEPMWKELNRIIKDNGAIALFGSQPFTSALVMSNPKMFKYEWIWHKSTSGGFASAKYSPMKFHENIIVFSKNKTTYNPQFMEYADSVKTRFSDGEKVNRTKQTLHSTNSIHDGMSYEGKQPILLSRGKYPESILKIKSVPNCNGIRLHPTQKPIELIEYLIKTYTNENETVLDFTMGSGTTGVACKNLNRNFIGIEKDDNYFKIASDRINA
jgi:site-specific DNA-methyltransferase (adenine-specific)